METQLLRQRTSPIDRLNNILEKLPQYEDRSAKGDVCLLSLVPLQILMLSVLCPIIAMAQEILFRDFRFYMPRHQYCSQPHFNFSVPLPTCRNG